MVLHHCIALGSLVKINIEGMGVLHQGFGCIVFQLCSCKMTFMFLFFLKIGLRMCNGHLSNGFNVGAET